MLQRQLLDPLRGCHAGLRRLCVRLQKRPCATSAGARVRVVCSCAYTVKRPITVATVLIAARRSCIGTLLLVLAAVSSLLGVGQRPGALALPAAPAQLFGASAVISAGEEHTCGVLTGGEVQCWGSGGDGQLGNGSLLDRAVPVTVLGIPPAAGVSVSAGGGHSCALLTGGAVRCWGANGYGQLGDGTRTPQSSAVAVSGLGSGVRALATGMHHTCVVMVAGGVKCWGANYYGQLGDNCNTHASLPLDVPGLANIIAISAGNGHTCALNASGGVKCWGQNGSGQLGTGNTTGSLVPVAVTGLASGVSAISAGGAHSCALLSTGAPRCWGNDAQGAVGGGGSADTRLPVPVSGLTGGVSALSAGGQHTCAVTTTGALKCWGDNGFGMLGDNSQINRPAPVDVSGAAGDHALVAAGGNHTCAILLNGSARCWGNNAHGQLGIDSIGNTPTAAGVTGLSDRARTIAAGDHHACAIIANGSIECWGKNDFGQLGDGTRQHAQKPVAVQTTFGPFTAITAGANHTCALASTGTVHCWGANDLGQLGDGTTNVSPTPTTVQGVDDITKFSAGANHSCAVGDALVLKCWGSNSRGQLGNNTVAFSTSPMTIPTLPDTVTGVAAGGEHTCITKFIGSLDSVATAITTFVYCWGSNDSAQFGDGTTISSHLPTYTLNWQGYGDVIAAGDRHSCTLVDFVRPQCWGNNLHGQVGTASFDSPVLSPAFVLGVPGAVQSLDDGGEHSCAITQAGALICWGGNTRGQLGTGSFDDANQAVAVSGLASGVTTVSGGAAFTCARLDTGEARCWGDDTFGQLGNGLAWVLVPRRIAGFVAMPTPTVAPHKSRLYLPVARRDPPPAPTASPTPIPCYQPDAESEPNDSAPQADGPLCSAKTYTGAPDNKDYWAVDLPANASLGVVYQNHTGGNRAFTIFRPDGSDLEYVPDAPANYSNSFSNLPAGRYLIYFNAGSGWNNTPYTLRVNFP